jgi:ABC-type protease/lipase transport system fused ATPase/permease subunit
MDFLTNLILYGFAFLGLILVVASIIGAAILAFQERFGHAMTDGVFDRALASTDRLHADAQQAIRDLEDLANRGDR